MRVELIRESFLAVFFCIVGIHLAMSTYGSFRFLAQKGDLLLIADQCQAGHLDHRRGENSRSYCAELRRAALRAVENGADPEKVEALVNISLN